MEADLAGPLLGDPLNAIQVGDDFDAEGNVFPQAMQKLAARPLSEIHSPHPPAP